MNNLKPYGTISLLILLTFVLNNCATNPTWDCLHSTNQNDKEIVDCSPYGKALAREERTERQADRTGNRK